MPYLKNMTTAQVRTWLVAQGYKLAQILALKTTTLEDKIQAISSLHEGTQPAVQTFTAQAIIYYE